MSIRTGFKWNGVHTSEIELRADAEILPLRPEPKIVLEELPAMDGFYNFSRFNNNGREHYRPRDWVFRCTIEGLPGADLFTKINKIVDLFAVYDGWLECDQCPGVRWEAVISNMVDMRRLGITTREFVITFTSQPFAEGFEKITLPPFSITDNADSITVDNPSTWFVRPDVYLTGQAANARIGGISVPERGTLNNVLAWAPELKPGVNTISITGFTGSAVFEFMPLYKWGKQ